MIGLWAAAALASGAPDISNLMNGRREPTITYTDAAGAVLGVRGGRYAGPVDVAALPKYVPGAFIAIEDRRFYEHSGVDPIGIARAIAADLAKGRMAQGASTITQQLARNLFLTPDQTMERKLEEMSLAVQLEQRYTKNQILGLYLSRVYFGSGAYGLDAAARRFFDKPAAKLTVAEAALLAGLLKSPTNYNPIEHPDHAAERARLVLDAMVETGAITPSQRRAALARPAQAKARPTSLAAQYFIDFADAETRRIMGPPKADLVVETTLDSALEASAQRAVQDALVRERRRDVEQAALVSLDGDGRVRAMVGGGDYAESPFNRAASAHRQAGSAWKPFVYLTAMEAGRTPDTPAVDEPVVINGWSPKNYEGGYLGPVTLRVAFAKSLNTVAARTADEVGRDQVARTAHRLGVASEVNTDPAMALGTTLVTPLEMTEAYAAFGNGGRRARAYGVERIRLATGRVLYQHRQEPQAQVIANPALSEMDDMLRGVLVEGTGRGAAVPGYDLGGKTGTTSDYKDAWFCGFAGDFATVVWMGRDDGSPMRGVTGGNGPATLWRAYMTAALPHVHAGPIRPGPPAPLQAPQDGILLPPAAAPATPVPPPASDPVDDLLKAPTPRTPAKRL